jgi:hypothetical protein
MPPAAKVAKIGSTFPRKQLSLRLEEVDATHWNSTFSNRRLPQVSASSASTSRFADLYIGVWERVSTRRHKSGAVPTRESVL